jgi:energy-coupling factor transporter ATP-binding protein EcfA2
LPVGDYALAYLKIENWGIRTLTQLEEKIMGARMRLGDLLTQANLVTLENVAEALARAASNGGRLGENLVAIGAIGQRVLDGFLKRIPAEPANIAATGIDEVDLLSLLMKLSYTGRLESCRQFIDAIKLPYHIVAELVQMAVDRQLLRTLGSRGSISPIEMSYAFTDEGKRWTIDALERLRYTGPAPVTLDEFTLQVSLQKLTNELVTFERIGKGLGDLTFDASIIEQAGPALNSGRAMLLYGPPGNGKTSFAHSLGGVYRDVIYVPYAITIEGELIRFFDPAIHEDVRGTAMSDKDEMSFVRAEEFDARWVPCRRPFVTTGGELTLDMLELRYDPTGHFYEAPLHVKALGGCFVIDDFGRQLVSPTNLLNRWIVPLENKIDYLKLHSGKSVSIPFEELVIFSTNLEPEDLMDPAFLRRLPYKIEVGSPSLEIYKTIFEKECAKQGMTLPSEALDHIVHKLKDEKGLQLAAYQPKFIVDQVVATCRFMGQPAHFEPRFIDYALNNLRVKRNTPTAVGSAPVHPGNVPRTDDSLGAPKFAVSLQ